jgi:ABC-type uncharacterized transport system substrate-binding protein
VSNFASRQPVDASQLIASPLAILALPGEAVADRYLGQAPSSYETKQRRIRAEAERGFRDGERLEIDRFNAQGDMPTGITIARQITGGAYDLVITSSTPAMQAVANNNRDGKVRHVFTLVADPFASGIGLDRAEPRKHPPHLVGQKIFPPVDRAFQLARRMLPTLARVGGRMDPAESNSLAFVIKAREAAKQMNLTLLEANVDNSSAVNEAIGSLIARSAQAIWMGGDNTVIAAMAAQT